MMIYDTLDIDHLQASLLPPFLESCGYHSQFKRSLVHGLAKYGCMNLNHLTITSGIVQLKYLISHIQQGNALGNSMILVLEQLQLFAGTSALVPTDVPTKLSNLPKCWFTTIQNFLKSINGTIEMPSAWTPGPLRQHDSLLMDVFNDWTTSCTKLCCLNACCLWLRVLTVSDITQTNGSHLCPNLVTGNSSPLPTSYNWPRQHYPSSKCWKLWKQAILANLVVNKSQL